MIVWLTFGAVDESDYEGDHYASLETAVWINKEDADKTCDFVVPVDTEMFTPVLGTLHIGYYGVPEKKFLAWHKANAEWHNTIRAWLGLCDVTKEKASGEVRTQQEAGTTDPHKAPR